MSAGRAVLIIIAVATIVRLILSASLGLGVDEAYMAGNARILSLSYVDHPPLHVWLASLSARLFGTESAPALRLPFILLFAGSTWLMFRLTLGLFGATAGVLAAIAFNVAPVFSVADGGWVLPDGPLIFFLLGATTVVAGILFGDVPAGRAVVRWTIAGALGGLALLSKYSAGFVFAGVFLFLLTTPMARRWLATAGPWLGVLAALLLFLPAIVWNAGNGFAGLGFQGDRFADLPAIKLTSFLGNIGGQAAYLSPWLFLGLVYGLWRAAKAGPSKPRSWFLLLLSAGPIVVFTILSLWVRSFPHWSMPGWLFALPLLGHEAARLAETRPRLVRGVAGACVVAFAVLLGAFAVQAIGGGIAKAGATDKVPRDPTVALLDWSALPRALRQRGLLDGNTVVAARDWISAGKASYALGPGVPVLCLCRQPHHFPFRLDRTPFAGRDVILVFPDYEKRRALASLQPYFDSLTPLDPVEVMRSGETVLVLDLMMGHGLQFGVVK